MANKIVDVRVDLYNHNFVFLVTRDAKFVEKYFNKVKTDRTLKLKNEDIEKITSGIGGLCWHGMKKLTVIWLPRLPRKPYDYGTLAHECTHAALQMLLQIGIVPNENNDEPLAWLTDYLVENFLKKAR